MFVMKRNQVVVTALAVMIAAAGYLNFQESRSSEGNQTALQLTEEGDVAALVEYSALPDDVSAEEVSLDPITAELADANDLAETTGDGAAVYVSAGVNAADSYFAEAKLDREQSRAKQKDILTEMLNNESISQEQKEKCTENMLQLQERIEKETAAEAMIESKGFKEAYVRMDTDTVDVVVDRDTLTDAEVAQIEDIVKRKTGYDVSKIRINTLQKK